MAWLGPQAGRPLVPGRLLVPRAREARVAAPRRTAVLSAWPPAARMIRTPASANGSQAGIIQCCAALLAVPVRCCVAFLVRVVAERDLAAPCCGVARCLAEEAGCLALMPCLDRRAVPPPVPRAERCLACVDGAVEPFFNADPGCLVPVLCRLPGGAGGVPPRLGGGGEELVEVPGAGLLVVLVEVRVVCVAVGALVVEVEVGLVVVPVRVRVVVVPVVVGRVVVPVDVEVVVVPVPVPVEVVVVPVPVPVDVVVVPVAVVVVSVAVVVVSVAVVVVPVAALVLVSVAVVVVSAGAAAAAVVPLPEAAVPA